MFVNYASLLEYVLVFVLNAFLGVGLTYLVFKLFFEKKFRGGFDTGTFIEFLRRIAERGVLHESDLADFPLDMVETVVVEMKRRGWIVEYGNERRSYVVNYANMWHDLRGVYDGIKSALAVLSERIEQIITLEDEQYDKLADLGAKAIGLIEFDTIQGPLLRYVTGLTGFIIRMFNDPSQVVRVYMAAQETASMETDTGERLLLARFSVIRDDRENPFIVFVEIGANADNEKLRDVLASIAERFNMRESVERDEFMNAIAEALTSEESSTYSEATLEE